MSDQTPGNEGWTEPAGTPPPPPPPPPGGYQASPPPPPGYQAAPGYGQAPPAWGGPPLAEFGSRAIALLIDGGIGVAIIIAAAIVGAILGAIARPLGALVVILGYLGVLGFSIWNSVIQQGNTGQSIGKKQQGIMLINEATGLPVGPGMAFVRYLVGSAISSVSCGIAGLLDYLWPLWDVKKQRLTDKILKFAVIQGTGVHP